ncbi:MAG: hydantoinase/oxoprolinase family protein [Lacipirellulaceae bacterium]
MAQNLKHVSVKVLAFDIGGANLKVADGQGYTDHRAFPLWKQPEKLADALAEMIADAPQTERIAITMTGELADCYETKAEGVQSIIEAAQQAASQKELSVYLVDGRFVEPREAVSNPLLAAASNWHALASFASRFVDKSTALLIDLGTTTCDIIPIIDGKPATRGLTDPERLATGELVYSGVERTPLFALVDTFELAGRSTPLAPELFATTADAYVLLGDLPEDDHNTDTPNGRPRTRRHAHARIARGICADASMMSLDEAIQAAELVRRRQLDQIAAAIQQVVQRWDEPPTEVLISGRGEFLLQTVLAALSWQARVLSLSNQLGPEVSRCATAYALAALTKTD